ncbi:hypothetical protein DUNSADRAFT_2519 [Dunaliella salina]|uniref:Uncharacterized protein n=1 Tax=Dunaliella salina TaxID=3046 RepID=A0ABQ7GVI7_DUNSA|nr:hypothetical protein DUNSADRAFT_2519 [Dunaliella salina]|eukprot:KAF5838610.1 hypothetical protein DUNSADRAFT_2519 [Dunaliella salina]
MAEIENWGSSKGRRSHGKAQEGIVAHSPNGERSSRHHVFSAHPTSPSNDNTLHKAPSPPQQPSTHPATPPHHAPAHVTPPAATHASPGSPPPQTPTPHQHQQTAVSPQGIGNRPHRWAHKEEARPKSAPPVHALRPFQKPLRASTDDEVWQQVAGKHGRLSLFDHNDNGSVCVCVWPMILRDLDPPRHGFPLRGPDEFLKRREGPDLRLRNSLSKWLARHPVSRDPPFRKGSGGLRLSWKDVPRPSTIFRYLYDNGTIDFVSIRPGGVTNKLVWGQWVKRGVMSWGGSPADVEIGKWLPIFMEGVREYEEPYRFLAIRGSEALICEAASGTGDQLLQCAAECVPPLRKALDTREPTAVAIALELMLLVLRIDPRVCARGSCMHTRQL